MKNRTPPAELAVKALAKRFDTTEANFSCFSTHEAGRSSVVAYAAMSGIDLGEGLRSWREIFDDKHDTEGTFLIRIGDDSYDCRQGMTRAVYERIVHLRGQHAGILPDSREWAEASGDFWTWTILTGNCAVYELAEGTASSLAKSGQKAYTPRKDSLQLVRNGMKVLRDTNSMPLIATCGGEVYVTGSDPLNNAPAIRFRPAVIIGEVV